MPVLDVEISALFQCLGCVWDPFSEHTFLLVEDSYDFLLLPGSWDLSYFDLIDSCLRYEGVWVDSSS